MYQILKEEKKKQEIQKKLHKLTEELHRINERLAKKTSARNDFDTTIQGASAEGKNHLNF